MTYIHPLWPDEPTPEQMQLGWALSQRALAVARNDKEKKYGEALAAYYENPQGRTRPERLASFHAGWRAAHELSDDDIEASLFYGLTKLSIASPGDKTYATQLEVGALAEKVLETIPDHPGGFHYAIHAYDIPSLAPRALTVASNYGKIAPEIPHALHMPSHIYTRLGHWQESIDWNSRSAEAAQKFPVEGKTSMHYFHASDYMVYAYLQQAEDDKAKAIWKSVSAITGPIQENGATMYALAGMPSRIALELQKWDDAAKLTVPHADLVNWDKFPAYEAIIHYARGIGAARSGKAEIVQDALNRQDSLLVAIGDSKSLAYWAEQLRIQRMAVEAWQTFSQGNHEGGLAQMQAAVEREAATEKHPVSPGEILPISELYGDMLLEAKKPGEALKQYENSLVRTPSRFNSLYGAGYAAEMTGDMNAAHKYYGELLKLVRADNSDRKQLVHAREILREHM
jgi:tetratricopeptide (TPR) repeat protein